MTQEKSRVPALTRALRVIETVCIHPDGLTLSELSRSLGAPKSSLLGICNSLIQEMAITRDSHGRYKTGIQIAELANPHLVGTSRLRNAAICLQNSSNPFFAVEMMGAQTAAAELGVNIQTFDALQSIEVQLRQLEDFLRSDMDAILLDAVDSNMVGEAVKRLRKRGKYVVAMNVGAAFADASVMTDNVQAGAIVARYLLDLLPEGTQIGIVGGNPVSAVADRILGFASATRGRPDVRICDRINSDHSETSGYESGISLLDRNRRIDGIFVINDPMAIGVASALKEKGSNIPVVSVDGASSAIAMIKSGHSIVATAAQDPQRIGRTALTMAASLVHGGYAGTKLRLFTPKLITGDSVAAYCPWG